MWSRTRAGFKYDRRYKAPKSKKGVKYVKIKKTFELQFNQTACFCVSKGRSAKIIITLGVEIVKPGLVQSAFITP